MVEVEDNFVETSEGTPEWVSERVSEGVAEEG